MSEVEKLIEIYNHLEDAGLMVIAGKKDSAELMVSRDVIPVVRCKDCKKRSTCLCPLCHCVSPRINARDDDFCSYGERKDNETV